MNLEWNLEAFLGMGVILVFGFDGRGDAFSVEDDGGPGSQCFAVEGGVSCASLGFQFRD